MHPVYSTLAATLLFVSKMAGAEQPATDIVRKGPDSASVAELIQKGDAFDRTFRPAEALQYYLPAEKLEPWNVQLLLRIARQYRHLMTDSTKSETKLQLGAKAMDYSRRVAALAPNDSEAQLTPGITSGKMVPLLSSKEQVAASANIKTCADNALRIDPRNDTAWHLLGRWHRGVAEVGSLKRTFGSLIYGKLPTSTYDAAVKCFEKAIALNPTRLMHYIELGRTYAKMGNKDDARRLIAKGLAMPDVEKDDPETKRNGRETVEKLR